MSDKKISELTASTTPLAGTELLPIVQSGTTKKTSVESVLNSVQPSGTANGVLYLNGSKVATSGSGLVFNGSNLGLGVAPSAWWANAKIMQFGAGASLFGSPTITQAILGANYYYNGTNNIYIGNGQASYYQQLSGVHSWATAPSSTAGSIITFTERFKVDANNVTVSTGNLVIGTAGKGIDFSADANAAGMTSELLDDYEEGTFTPTISGSTSFGVGTYTTQKGYYTKIGNQVFFQVNLVWTAHTGIGPLRLTALPFVGNADINQYVLMTPSNIALTASHTMSSGYVIPGSTHAYLIQAPVGGGASTTVAMDTAGTLNASGSYFV